MCRMTEDHVRGKYEITAPGKYLVCGSVVHEQYYVRMVDWLSLEAYRWMNPLYAITVRPKYNPQHLMYDA
jgi:hypothetical protein